MFFLFAQNQKTVDIMFMHDVHSFLDRMAKAKTVIEEQKEKNPNTFIFDAGDFSMGTLYHTVFETQACELRLLGKLGVDASTLGNHEFDFGAEGLESMLNAAFSSEQNLPKMVLCNIDYSEENDYTKKIFPTLKKYFKDYEVIQKGDIKIAVIGVFGVDALLCAPTCQISFLDPVQAVKKTVSKIKENENVDMIVCVSHGGTNSNPKKSEDELLAKKVSDIDLIISGHTHTLIENAITVGNTTIVSCGSYCKYVGNLTFSKNKENRWDLQKYDLLSINNSIPDDKEIAEELEKYAVKIDDEYLAQFELTKNQILTYAEDEIQYPDEVGLTIEKAIKQTIDNSVLEDDGNPVDFVVIPSGCVRESYQQGAVTVNDVFTSYSLGIGPDRISGYPLVYSYLYGKELKAVAELDCSLSPIMNTVRMYIHNFSYDYNPNRLIFDKVTDVYIVNENGERQKLQNDRLYKIVCDMYSANTLAGILSTTKGLVSIIPKDKNGNTITDFNKQIIYIKNSDGNKVELKAWYAIAKAFENIDILESCRDEREKLHVKEASINPIKYFRNPSKIGVIIYITVFVIILIITSICVLIQKNIKKHKNQAVKSL